MALVQGGSSVIYSCANCISTIIYYWLSVFDQNYIEYLQNHNINYKKPGTMVMQEWNN